MIEKKYHDIAYAYSKIDFQQYYMHINFIRVTILTNVYAYFSPKVYE